MRLSDITTKELAAAEIERLMDKGGSHTHNLLAMVLDRVDKNVSPEAASELIEEFGLTLLYGIKKKKK
jgi:hypothetical protein